MQDFVANNSKTVSAAYVKANLPMHAVRIKNCPGTHSSLIQRASGLSKAFDAFFSITSLESLALWANCAT